MGLYEANTYLSKHKHNMIIDIEDTGINNYISQEKIFYQISKLVIFFITCSKKM